MHALCEITLNESATTDQLKELAAQLARLCDSVEEYHGCFLSVASQQMADLLAGELPAPQFVKMMNDLEQENKARKILGLDTVTLDSSQRRRLQDELGKAARERCLFLHIEYSEDCRYEEALEELRSMFDHSLVRTITVSEVPEDDELNDDFVD